MFTIEELDDIYEALTEPGYQVSPELIQKVWDLLSDAQGKAQMALDIYTDPETGKWMGP